MDFPVDEELQFQQVIKESISIPKQAPKTFTLISLTLILPLSIAILAHSIFTIPLLDLIAIEGLLSTRHQWTQFIILQFGYPVLLFVFSLLSTAALVFTVASIYTFRPVSFISTLSAIPPVFKRIFITFLFVSVLLILCNVIFLVFFAGLIYLLSFVSVFYDHPTFLFLFCSIIFSILFLPIYTYITALWHLASVISVLEPMYGRAAMKKSMQLLKGKTGMAMLFVLLHLGLCCLIEGLFGFAMLKSWKIKAPLGALLVVSMVILNLVGLLVQSILYYVCKVYHNEKVDKNELQQHLGGYVGELVPLNSTIELQNQNMEAGDM